MSIICLQILPLGVAGCEEGRFLHNTAVGNHTLGSHLAAGRPEQTAVDCSITQGPLGSSRKTEKWGVIQHAESGVRCSCSVAKSSPTLCDPMDCSTPNFLVLHYLLEFV